MDTIPTRRISPTKCRVSLNGQAQRLAARKFSTLGHLSQYSRKRAIAYIA
jgi:hypothetical protein